MWNHIEFVLLCLAHVSQHHVLGSIHIIAGAERPSSKLCHIPLCVRTMFCLPMNSWMNIYVVPWIVVL